MRKIENIQDRKTALAAERERLHKKGGKKKKWLWLLLLPLLALLIGLAILLHNLGYFLWPWETRDSMISGNLAQTGDRDDLAALQDEAADNSLYIQINTMPVFENGEGDLIIVNPEGNQYNMRVFIYLGADDTGQLVYDSGVIPPGHHIGYDKLNTTLTRGEHEAIAYITFLDGDTPMITNTASMKLVIES